VEKGQAPAELIGVHPKPGVSLDYFGIDTRLLQPDQIAFSRPSYVYPLKAYYSGRGDPNDASSFAPGLKPLGKQAPAAHGQGFPAGEPPAAIAASLGRLNVTDRIAKAIRRQVYLSAASPNAIASALDQLLSNDPSAIAKPALKSVRAEYSSGGASAS
jgi:hypothetical protein